MQARLSNHIPRRQFLAGSLAAGLVATTAHGATTARKDKPKAQIAITLDLEMSRHYPRRGLTEWDYQKGNLDQPTKEYAVKAGQLVKKRGGVLHYFCVGRVLEQPDVSWLQQLAELGHPIGNHTYDHVNLRATTPAMAQFRFQRSPWLVKGKTVPEILRENIRLTTIALKERAKIDVNGFRTPGGFRDALNGREDLQQLLLEQKFSWVSSKYPRHAYGKPKEQPTEDVYQSIVDAQQQAQPFRYPSGLIEIPMSPISDVGAFRSTYWKLDYFLEAITRAVRAVIARGQVFDFLAHPSCLVVEDPEMKTIERIMDLVADAGDRAEIVGLDTIAKRVPPLKP